MHNISQFLQRGEKLGKYEILRLLNVGGTGELYLARTGGIEGFEKLVAIKRVLPQFAAQPEFERMLLDEARLMATLHHPNIAQVYDVGRQGDDTFFTMEYVHGENLQGVLKGLAARGRGMTLANALFLVSNVAAGLHYAHEKKRADGTPLLLVHRDISPANIMITHDGGTKLIDFGLAKVVARQSQTRPGATKGNTRYMSPEQCLGAAMDRRSDIFSLGIILFELTTGTRWIRERDDYAAVQRMLNEPLPLPSERRTKYDPALEVIVMKALARQPQDRYQSAQALQLDLEAYALENKLPLSNVVMRTTMAELFTTAARLGTERELQPSNDGALGGDIPTETARMSRSPISAQVQRPLAPTVAGQPFPLGVAAPVADTAPEAPLVRVPGRKMIVKSAVALLLLVALTLTLWYLGSGGSPTETAPAEGQAQRSSPDARTQLNKSP